MTERTELPFPSRPDPERTWEDYFREYGAARRAAKAAAIAKVEEEAAEDYVAFEVLEPGHDLADPLAAPGAPGTLARRLAGAGFTVRVCTSRVAVPAVLYKSASEPGAAKEYSVGDVRTAAHEQEIFVVVGVKRAGGQAAVVDAGWTLKSGGSMKFTGATTYDPMLGEEWRPTSLKPRPQRDWEIEEGVEAPMGLNEWLAFYAPTAASKKKQAKAAEAALEIKTEEEWRG